jgi:DNA-binding transcriptional regulator GbsR (MarR family)
MGVRQLEQWGAVEKVWIKGDRKDYYRACDGLGAIVKNAVFDLAGKRMADAAALLDEVERKLVQGDFDGDAEAASFLRRRVENVRAFHRKAQGVWESVIVKILLR